MILKLYHRWMRYRVWKAYMRLGARAKAIVCFLDNHPNDIIRRKGWE